MEMTDAVAERVLYASYTQAQALSLALAQAPGKVDVHARLIRHLEEVADLNRELESLPDEDAIAGAQGADATAASPHLSWPWSWPMARSTCTPQLLASDLPEDATWPRTSSATSRRRCPRASAGRWASIACGGRSSPPSWPTSWSIVPGRRLPSGWPRRLARRPPILARGFAVAREVFDMRSFWSAVEDLDHRVPAQAQLGMLLEGRRLVERATRRLVRARPRRIDIERTSTAVHPAGAELLAEHLPQLLDGEAREGLTCGPASSPRPACPRSWPGEWRGCRRCPPPSTSSRSSGPPTCSWGGDEDALPASVRSSS